MIGEVDAQTQDNRNAGRNDADADDEGKMLKKLNLVDLVMHIALLSHCLHDTPVRVIFCTDYSSFLIKLRFLHLRKKARHDVLLGYMRLQ